MKIGIKDIAAQCGVSPATVSRVFNRHPNVREEVRMKVISAARELGFVPHSGNGKKVIAVITNSYSGIAICGYLGMAITALTREIFERGFSMELVPRRDIGLLNENMICGAFSLVFDEDLGHSWGKENSLPLVCINTGSRHSDGVFSVSSNEEQGMQLAYDHLYRNGHRRIGLLLSGSPDGNWCNRNRVAGFKTAALAHGNPSGDNWCRHTGGSDNIFEPLGQLLQTGVTAIISTGETAGIAVAYALTIFGRRIPQDISLITYEQDNVSRYCIPRHTTLSQDFTRISSSAMTMLESVLEGRPPQSDILVDYNLIERDSVAGVG